MAKWCVTLGNDGWGFYLHKWKDESDNDAMTDTYNTFAEAKRECLARYRDHLDDVKKAIAEIKAMRSRSGEASK